MQVLIFVIFALKSDYIIPVSLDFENNASEDFENF